MSLDFYLEAPRVVEVFDANYTHNVTSMWRKAGCYRALYESAGAKAHAIIPELRAAVEAMRADPDGFKALDAPNKWGTYETALPWLESVLRACEENPDATIRVSR